MANLEPDSWPVKLVFGPVSTQSIGGGPFKKLIKAKPEFGSP